MFSWGQSQFDDAVEKATSELRLAEEDIALNLEICDQIRSKSVQPKDAARALRRRLGHRNPNVQLLTLGLTDVCVKNGGDHFLLEIAGKEFIDNMVSLLRAPDCNPDVRARILRLVQNWATAFEGKPALGYVAQVYKDLSSRGFEFPPRDPALANSAMIDTSTAPEWIDSDLCMRCRTPFSFTNRKHHCRNCGQVFDQQCSSRSMPLPHFGIAQDVRVCDSCHTQLTRRDKKERSQSVDFHAGYHNRPSRHRHHDLVDADLQRAIQLSLAESNPAPYAHTSWNTSEPPLIDRTTQPRALANEDDDPELRAAIEASLREARAPRPSAPYAEPGDPVHSAPTPEPAYGVAPPPLPVLPNHDLHPREEDAILTFNQTVQDEPGTARRDLARVHALYDQASGLRPKLALSLDDAGRKEQMLGEMHQKLSQAVKLYDQLLTEQLARPVWQRSALSRAGTWHAGAPERQGPYRAEARVDLHRQPSQPYQTPPSQPYQVQQPQPSQPHLTQQQPSQPFPPQQRAQRVSQVYPTQQSEPSQPYQAQQPYQTHQREASQPHHQRSQPFQQPSLEYQQQQPPPRELANPTQQQPSQAYHPQSPASATPSTSYQQQEWSRPLYEQQQQPQQFPTSAQPPTPGQEHLPQQQYQPPQHVSPRLVPTAPPPQQHTGPSVTQPATTSAQRQYATPPAARPQEHPESLQSPPVAPSNFQPVPSSPPAQVVHQAVHPLPPAQSFYQTHAPMFPTAPTSNPQSFPLYGPGAPLTGLEQTAKKEVALIDL